MNTPIQVIEKPFDGLNDLAGTQSIGETHFGYDNVGRILDITHSNNLNQTIAGYSYVYNAVNLVTNQVHHGQHVDYVYDKTGQLLEAVRSTSDNERYEYDDNGNRTSRGEVVGDNNQVHADSNIDYNHDAEGNLIGKLEIATGHLTEYAYDHRNRLIRVEEFDSRNVNLIQIEYVYDALDRRIAKTVNGEAQYFVYDGENAWADFDQSGNLIAQYLFGNRDDEILARYRPNEGTAWYLTDKLGTIHDLINEFGLVINHVDYDSFGGIVAQTDLAAGDRFLFTGREFDFETGLYYYRARYYDPLLGRFISQDPISFAGNDANLYRYVGNSPLNATDPTGNLALIEYAKLTCDIALKIKSQVKVLADCLKDLYTGIANALETGTGNGHGLVVKFGGCLIVGFFKNAGDEIAGKNCRERRRNRLSHRSLLRWWQWQWWRRRQWWW